MTSDEEKEEEGGKGEVVGRKGRRRKGSRRKGRRRKGRRRKGRKRENA